MFNDNFFNKVERKTNVKKSTILDMAKKIQNSNFKDENTIREVVKELGKLTGKNISKEKEDKIVKAALNDKVPKNIDKMF